MIPEIYPFIFLLAAYLIGSFPTALLVSHSIDHSDIRGLGDGSMGARNTQHVFGWRAGFIVALIDFCKGAGVISLARLFELNLTWQILSGVAVVLGHDFPLFADFKGGQGMAASLGTMSMLFWEETLIGFLLFALVYLMSRNFDLSASLGLGLMVLLLVKNLKPHSLIAYSVLLLVCIPIKKFWDSRHRLPRGA